jgi:hypothetical protein
MRIAIFASLVLALGNFNCSKKDSSPKINADLIIGDWTISALNYSPMYDFDGDGLKESNAYSKMEPCEKDDIYSFLTGGTWKRDEGASKCDPSDPQIVTGNWQLSTNQTTMNIDGDNLEIKFLSNTTLTLESTFMEMGVSYTQTITFQRK